MATYRVRPHLPGTPNGEKVFINGLGEYPNGRWSEVPDEMAEQFRGSTGRWVDTKDGKREFELGPTPLQALKSSPVIDCETIEDEDDKAEIAPKSAAKEGKK
jgi:hypothetical protein